MEHEAVIEYICPRCGAQIPADEQRCPGCGAMLDWLEERGAPDAPSAPAEGPPTSEDTAPAEGVPSEVDAAIAEEAPTAEEEVPTKAPAAPGGSGWEELATREDERPDAASPDTASKPFGFLYSNVGAISFAVMLVAFVGTMLVLRWDTWVGGAEVETIGRLQLAAASAGIATIIVTGSLGVWDALRSLRA